MKKILTLAVAGLISAAAFAETTVSSANIVGYVKAVQQSGLQIINSPFAQGSLTDVVPTNGIGGVDLASGDNIHIYIPGEGYKNYFLAGDVGDPAYNYKWIDNDTFEVATNQISTDVSFWYRNRSATTNELLFSGDVVMDTSITNAIVEGLQQISYPYSTEMGLNDMCLTNGLGGVDLASGDNIHLYIPGEGYKNYFFAGDVGDTAFNYKWIDNDTFEVATNKIPMETGFWYRCRKVGGYTWIVNRPYLND